MWTKISTSNGESTTITKGSNGHIIVDGTDIFVYDDASVRALISTGGSTVAVDSSGLFYSYQNLWVSGVSNQDFIPVEPETEYISNCLKTIPCYDENQQLISSVTPTLNNDANYFAPRPFVTPVGTKYIKPSMPGIFNTAWNQRIVLIKGGIDVLPVHFQYVGSVPPDLLYMTETYKQNFFFRNSAHAISLGNQTSPLYGKKINFLGDSITNGNWADPDSETGTVITYHQLIGRRFNAVARNYGYAGSGFANTYDIYDPKWGTNAAYFQRVAAMDADADLNVVWGGFNDRFQPLGAFGDTWSDASPTVYGGIDQLIKNLKTKFPNTPTIFLIHFANDELTTPINNAVKDMCHLNRIPYIDLSGTILSDNYNRTILEEYFRVSDWDPNGNQGIHPNTDGYKIIASYITKKLEDILAYV